MEKSFVVCGSHFNCIVLSVLANKKFNNNNNDLISFFLFLHIVEFIFSGVYMGKFINKKKIYLNVFLFNTDIETICWMMMLYRMENGFRFGQPNV
jgi:hypothetical protein